MSQGKTRVSVMYPNTEGSTFDMDYYLKKHLPMVGGLLADITLGTSMEKGGSGPAPGSAPPYMVIFHLYCNTPEEFTSAFAQHAPQIAADFANYTNVQPEIQISEVMD